MNFKKIETLISLTKGKKPLTSSSDKKINGYFPYVDIKAFETGVVDNYTDGVKCVPCKKGDLLIVCDGSRSGLVGKAVEGYVGSTLAKIDVNDEIDVCYLYYFIQGKYQILNTNVKGTGTPHLKQDLLKSFKIYLPSIDEQRRIVTKIEGLFSKLDKGVEELNKIKEQLKIYRQAVLKEAFEGKWSYDNRQGVNIETVDKTLVVELPILPNEWEYVYLNKLGELSRGKSKHRPRNDKKLFEGGKYPFVQTGDVKAANKYLTSYSTMYGEFGLAQSKLWKKGTLCITIAANIAETCILGIDACFPDSVVGFDPQEGIVDRDYVRYFIEASKIRLSAFAPATAQKNINLTTLENLIIPYCHIDEQKYIVTEIESRLSVCDKIEQTINESLQKAESLRQSILKQAFEGNLV